MDMDRLLVGATPNSAPSRSPRGPDGDYPAKLTGTGLAADPSVLSSTTVASRRMASDARLASAPSPVSAARAPASEAPPHGPAGIPLPARSRAAVTLPAS